jgi:hypothetical protein
MFIPDPDPDFFLSIPDPGVKKTPNLGSGSATLENGKINYVPYPASTIQEPVSQSGTISSEITVKLLGGSPDQLSSSPDGKSSSLNCIPVYIRSTVTPWPQTRKNHVLV